MKRFGLEQHQVSYNTLVTVPQSPLLTAGISDQRSSKSLP